MQRPIPEMQHEPYGEDYMFDAWFTFLKFAFGIERYRDQFKEETGIDLLNIIEARGLDKMIDESTGRTKDAVIKWADWVTENLWGIADGHN